MTFVLCGCSPGRRFARIWKEMPRIVFSKMPDDVGWNSRHRRLGYEILSVEPHLRGPDHVLTLGKRLG